MSGKRMLLVNPRIRIPDSEIEFTYVRSSGPGGQNVNKVNSKAVLRWAMVESASLPADVRARFLEKFKNRLTAAGDVIISSQRYRDQARNANDALEKLGAMLAAVAVAPKKRRATRPTKASRVRREKAKQISSRKKQLRRKVQADD